MTDSTLRPPRRVILRATGLAGTALMAAALLAWTPTPATGWNQASAEGTLWQLMNGARVNNGRRAVQSHGTLVSLARWRSKDQVDRNYFDHTVKGTGYQVFHWYDINGLSYSWGGENIGWNNGMPDSESPIKIHEGFMASPGHRANVLEPAFTHGGVGAYAATNVSFLGATRSPRFYTELFMVARSSAPPPPPPSGGGGTPPPPSGGGGGGGGGTSRPPSAPAATAAPKPSTQRVDRPAAPRASTPLDGGTLVAATPRGVSTASVRATAWTDPLHSEGPAAPASQVASSLRVESAQASEQGMFESVLGSLLGFFL